MQDDVFNEQLLAFIEASPSPFHATEQMAGVLAGNGFVELKESESWNISPGSKCFVTRNDSSIVAFSLGPGALSETGMHMVGAHTDSPCLRVKPNPELIKEKYLQLGVEVYGGALLNPWFDRDLSLAGRVSYLNKQDEVCSALVNFEIPIAVIPSLAIHLDRKVNEKREINAQMHLPPVLMRMPKDDKPDFRDILYQLLNKQHPESSASRVLEYELCFYDTQPPAIIGLHQDFIASARLDDLLSCYTGLAALLEAGSDQACLLVCNDHEEVGSASACGAQGPFLKSVLQRLCNSIEAFSRCIDHSVMISADNAHGIHPNYSDKHDGNHGPILNKGPVIKVNSNQRYATSSETSAMFRQLCQRANVPVQSFVTRTDMACGSTIGPITASEIGVKTIDVGVPTFAMHSIRELAGRWDGYYLYRALREFFH